MESKFGSLQLDSEASIPSNLIPSSSSSSLGTFNPIVEALTMLTLALSLLHMHNKKMKVQWQVIRNFQDTWATKLPWAKLVIGEDNKLHHVRCKVCTDVEHREKLLVLKLDGLHKHNGKRKCKCAKLGQIVGEYYTSFDTQLAKNFGIHYIIGLDFGFTRW